MDYNKMDTILQGRTRQQKKYANNTYLVRHNDYLACLYHNTEVVKFYPNGDIVLDNGGWYTSTTKERINWMLDGHRLSQSNGVWFINDKRFQPGMIIKADGSIQGEAKDNPKADKQLKAKVKKYAQLCAANLPLDKPSNGDCWYCSMTTQDDQSLGDAVKSDHLDSHMEEEYIVPSLVFRALRESGNTDFILSLVFNNPEGHMLDIAKERVYRSVYRYILKRKGYAI